MRSLFLLVLSCASLAACSDAPTMAPLPAQPVDRHVCEVGADDAADADAPWTEVDTEACYTTCDQGHTQGRLACLSGGTYAPDLMSDAIRDASPRYVGWTGCYPDGWIVEGCKLPTAQ